MSEHTRKEGGAGYVNDYGPECYPEEAFRGTHAGRLREWYHGILLVFDGKRCPVIAQWLSRDEETIRIWAHAVNQAGQECLEREMIPGRPA